MKYIKKQIYKSKPLLLSGVATLILMYANLKVKLISNKNETC